MAIVGMACMFPGAPNLASFWSNIVSGVDAIRDVSEKEWDEREYYDPDATAFGHTYCKRGGFITDLATFDPLKFGVMPAAVAGSDPDQFLALKVAHDALLDCGYPQKPINLVRAEVILGRISAPGAGAMNLIQQSKTVHELVAILESLLPEGNAELIEQIEQQIKQRLTPCTSDNIPGVMPNILTGRIAAKLGFQGRNMLIDSACASSMVAVETAADDLISGRCDFALAGGVHVNSSATMFNLFSGLGALSKTQVIRPFDDHADGTLLGEGIGILALKRHEDAIADGDRIYATILGVASTSDGLGGSVIAPSLKGEALAMNNAYAMAGVSPATIELLEAHGTGTPTGDVIELQAIQQVFSADERTKHQWCALGSVKSMIGHCQSASAAAGIIKTALALHHKVLPPTLNVDIPTSKIDWTDHPCYINKRSRPWISAINADHPRRAAVSAFGFGGINSHIILEETQEERATSVITPALNGSWDSEIFTFSATNEDELQQQVDRLISFVELRPDSCAKDIAYTLNCSGKEASPGPHRLAIVASSNEDLLSKLRLTKQRVVEPERGIYLTPPSGPVGGKLAFLYPGLGSAYTNMLHDLCLHFPEVRQVFDIVDQVAQSAGAQVRPSDLIFPRTTVDSGDTSDDLASADFAVVAVLLAEFALHELLKHLKIFPDVLMGCSTGEFAAIVRGSSIDVLGAAETFYRLSTDVGRRISLEAQSTLKSIRVLAAAQDVVPIAAEIGVHLAADLGEDHLILTGEDAKVDKLVGKLKDKRLVLQVLPSPIAYHTPLVGNMVDSNETEISAIHIGHLSTPTWSCALAGPYPNDPEVIRACLTKLFAKPISLKETILSMYGDGVFKFVEVGPNGVLSALVRSILGKSPALVVASNLASRSGLTQLHHLLAALFTNGLSPDFTYLYERRNPQKLNFSDTKFKLAQDKPLPLSHTALAVSRESLPDIENEPTVSDSGPSLGSTEESVMSSFFETNTAFMERMTTMQEQVMTAFLSRVTDQNRELEPAECADLAFLSGAQLARSEDQSSAMLKLDLNCHLYLLDHAIGGCISTNPGLRVYLLPLMVALEIMAEVAHWHANAGVVKRLEQIKAFKRIVVDSNGLALRIIARGHGPSVHVELFQADDESPSMCTTVVFDQDFEPSSHPRLNVNGAQPRNLLSESSLYQPSAMFHGTRMQSVVSLKEIGHKSIVGTVNARIATGWFPDTPMPRFLLDPLLLDNASQLVLFYLYEQKLPATALLPFFIESIEFFFDRAELAETVTVSAVLTALSDRSTEAVVEVVDENQNLWCRLNNITSRRVILDASWRRFIENPLNNSLGQQVSTNENIDSPHALVKVSQSILPPDEGILEWCLDYLLTDSERHHWKQELKFDKRRNDWLLGRIAAKEAVSRLVLVHDKEILGPCDIEITNDDHRVPRARIHNHPTLQEVSISISHTAGAAAALAVFTKCGRPGIDIEGLNTTAQDFEKLFLSNAEQDFLNSQPALNRPLEAIKLWSAKEAAYKAYGGQLEMRGFESRIPASGIKHQIHLRNLHEQITVDLKVSEDHVLAYAIASPPEA